MRATSRPVLLLAVCCVHLALGAAPAAAQVCVPGVTVPGCEPPTGPPPPPGQPPSPPPPPPAEPSPTDPPCAIDRPAGRGAFAGLVSEQVYVGGAGYRRCALSQQARAGVRILRQALRWREIEYAQGKYTFVYFDGYVRALAEHGIRLMPILFDPPDWHSSRPASGAKRGVYPPRRNKAMASFAARVVRRYGSKGSFWRENGDLPKVPVRDWQVWNEPNFPHYWPPKPNAKKYVALQRTVAKAIRKADRKANVLTAGLPNSAAPGAVPLTRYIKAMYKARGRGTFDTLAVNAYATSAKAMIKQVKSVRKIMRRRRDRSRIWVTEIGWATQGPKSRFTVSPRRQAELIRQTFDKAAKQRRRLGIRGVVYFNWQDSEPYEGFHDFWGLHTGLLDSEGAPKPGLAAFTSRAKRHRNIR